MSDHEPHIEMSYEEAKKVIEEDNDKRAIKHLVDDVYPWWVTFRRPFMILSVVIGVLCVAIIFLSITLSNMSAERERDNERNACYSLYTSASTDAIARVRAASSSIDLAGWEALVTFAETGEIDSEDVAGIRELADVTQAALDEDEVRLGERAQWVLDGKPLPCPIESEAFENE